MQHPEPYHFAAATKADLPLLAQWLAGAHLRDHWGTPEDELALIANDLANPQITQLLIYHKAAPIAYLQSYPCQTWPAPQFSDFPHLARATDLFIGPPAALGIGHGCRFLRQFAADTLKNGSPAVLIDPDPSNERAVRSYRRAGFTDIGLRHDANGKPVQVMAFTDSPFICS